MQRQVTVQRIGSIAVFNAVILGAAFGAAVALAASQEFTAQVDQTAISMDDTVSLTFSLKGEGNAGGGQPEFSAPDFEVVNEYNSISVNSQYDSSVGRFSTVRQQQITKVLQPQKTGNLRISGMSMRSGNSVLRASDIIIRVSSSGQRQAPQQSPQQSPQQGLQQRMTPGMNRAAPPDERTRSSAFVRAEVEKETVFKGEQVVVSYYLYHQGKVFNIQVEKFPVLPGFLREDLDIPVMTQRLDTEEVEIKGVPYHRSLLARYAAYPLEEGRLVVEPLALKYQYLSSRADGRMNSPFGEDDPFFGFFQQLAPRIGSSRSEPIPIQVLPLPEQDRPKSFTGGVGEFSVSSAIDKYEVRANEAVTLTVKVEGRGNLSAIQPPSQGSINQWPSGLELYDTKGKVSVDKTGRSTKIFEFLLIPRTPGVIQLPNLTFGFFSPQDKKYYERSTEGVQLKVLDPAPGAAVVVAPQANANPSSTAAASRGKPSDLRDLKTPQELSSDHLAWLPGWRFFYWACVVALLVLGSLVGVDLIRRLTGRSKLLPRVLKGSGHGVAGSRVDLHARLKHQLGPCMASPSTMQWSDVVHAYEILTEELLNSFDVNFGIGARSLARSDLEHLLTQEKGVPQSVWEKARQLFEFADLVRFATLAGSDSEGQARSELLNWVRECDAFIKNVEEVAKNRP